MRPRRRRPILAVPFVITASLAPACGARETQPNEPMRTSNPPEPSPDPDAKPTPPPAPAGKGAWREDYAGHWIYTYESGDQIWYDEGGCELRQAMDCPEDATCNPPPPQAVACPDGLPDEAKK